MTTLARVQAVFGEGVGTNPTVLPFGRHELPKLFAAAGFTRGAEIGVWKGGFSEVLCLRVPNLDLLCVDPWESYAEYDDQKNVPGKISEAYAEAMVRLAKYRCRILRERSVHAAAQVPDRSLDFVYIDGNHGARHVRDDLEAWTPKIRPGGVLAGHDYREHPSKPFIQVKAAVDAFVAEHAIASWFVLSADKSPSFFWVVT